jgi:hypothetical protein
MQVNALNTLNIILVHAPLEEQSFAAFLSDHHVLQKAVTLLSDGVYTRLHAKALLACGLLIRLGSDWLRTGIEAKMLDKIRACEVCTSEASFMEPKSSGQELAQYIAACSDVLLASVRKAITRLLELVRETSIPHNASVSRSVHQVFSVLF